MRSGTSDASARWKPTFPLFCWWAVVSLSVVGTTAEAQEPDSWSPERVGRLFSVLPATFEVADPVLLPPPVAAVAFVEGWRYRVGASRASIRATGAEGGTSFRSDLRGWLDITHWETAAAAAAEAERIRRRAEPETGLSYGWDVVFVQDDEVYELHLDCTFSEGWFERLVEELLRSVAGPDQPSSMLRCRCGGGCASVEPDAGSPRTPAHLPSVFHSEGDLEEYDDRIDPSGLWTGVNGELALMHRANTLSFAYLAVFGDAAHVCEGAGVAGLTGTDRYEYVDEQGTLVFLIQPRGVRVELVSGIASFCGAGWSGEGFDIDRFEPPVECRVTSPAARFHVVDHVDADPRPSAATRGARLEVAPAPGGGGVWFLARASGDTTHTVGLVRRADVSCAPTRLGSPGRVR